MLLDGRVFMLKIIIYSQVVPEADQSAFLLRGEGLLSQHPYQHCTSSNSCLVDMQQWSFLF